MELFLKKYFWIFDLLVIALCSYILASTASGYIAFRLHEMPEKGEGSNKAASASYSAKQQGAVDFSALRERNPFGGKPPAQIEEEMEAAAQERGLDAGISGETCAFSDDLPVSESRLQLVATVKAKNPRWSIAVINDAAANRVDVYGSGSALSGGAVLDQILRGQVVIRREGRCEVLNWSAEASASLSLPPSGVPPPSVAMAGEAGEGVKKISETEYVVAKTEIESSLSNLSQIATQARIVPHFQDGKAAGFKLFSIRPGSIYSKIGIQNGDVIKRINGYEIDTPDKALELYQKLREARNVTIEIERRGQLKTMSYQIR